MHKMDCLGLLNNYIFSISEKKKKNNQPVKSSGVYDIYQCHIFLGKKRKEKEKNTDAENATQV